MSGDRVKREYFVNRSFIYFVLFAFLCVLSTFVGFGYLFLYWDFIDTAAVGIKVLLFVTALAVVTYICWRTYVADSQLLRSSADKYMHVKTGNIDSLGINFPDGGDCE